MSVGMRKRSSSKRSTLNLDFSSSNWSMPFGFVAPRLGSVDGGGAGGGATSGSGNAGLCILVGWLKSVCFNSSPALLLFEASWFPLLAEWDHVATGLHGHSIPEQFLNHVLIILRPGRGQIVRENTLTLNLSPHYIDIDVDDGFEGVCAETRTKDFSDLSRQCRARIKLR